MRFVISFSPPCDPLEEDVATIMGRLEGYPIEIIGHGSFIVDTTEEIAKAAVEGVSILPGITDWHVSPEGKLRMSSRAIRTTDLSPELIEAIEKSRMAPLKMFVFDEGVYGATVIAASSEERAWEILKEKTDRYPSEVSCEEVELAEGVISHNRGDA